MDEIGVEGKTKPDPCSPAMSRFNACFPVSRRLRRQSCSIHLRLILLARQLRRSLGGGEGSCLIDLAYIAMRRQELVDSLAWLSVERISGRVHVSYRNRKRSEYCSRSVGSLAGEARVGMRLAMGWGIFNLSMVQYSCNEPSPLSGSRARSCVCLLTYLFTHLEYFANL